MNGCVFVMAREHARARPLLALALILMCVSTMNGCNRLGRIPHGFRGQPEAGLAVVGGNYTLSANTTVDTNEPIHFTVKSNESAGRDSRGRECYPDFRGYVHPQGPSVGGGDTGVTFTSPVIVLGSGWGFFVGMYPAARTGRVGAVAIGTTIVMEIDTSGGGEVHRVYFIKGKGVDVYVPWNDNDPLKDASGNTPLLSAPGTYMEVRPDDNDPDTEDEWVAKGPYAADSARKAFIERVLREVRSKGVK